MLASLILLCGISAGVSTLTFGAVQMHRRQVRTAPRTFRCALRAVSGDVAGFRRGFAHRAAYARWVRDVLLVWSGITL